MPDMPALISSYQTLGPRARLQRQGAPLPFPLSHDRFRTYYLGRNALYHGVVAAGLGKGDEIVFPAYHSGTESSPLQHLGCKLRLYNVAADLSIDLDEIEARITTSTKALYAIHFFGFPGPIAEMRQLADRYGLLLIEDVALSMLAQTDGRPLGTFGDFSIFCLYKTVPTAAGGVLAINRADIPLPAAPPRVDWYNDLNLTLKRRLAHMEQHGGAVTRGLMHAFERFARFCVRRAKLKVIAPDAMDFQTDLLEYDLGPLTRRMLPRFDYEWIASQRRANYQWLVDELAGSDVTPLRRELPEGAVPLFFPVLAKDKFGLVSRLHAEGIEAIPVWGLHHPHVPRGEFPSVEFLVDHLVEVPVYQDLSADNLERIRDGLLRHAPWAAATDERERFTYASV
jgi:perosamine synthetase